MGTQPMFWKLAIPFYLFIQTAVGKLFPDGKKFKHPDGQKYIALKETQITTFAPEDLKDFNPKQVRGKEMDSYLDTIKKDLNLETQGEYTILNALISGISILGVAGSLVNWESSVNWRTTANLAVLMFRSRTSSSTSNRSPQLGQPKDAMAGSLPKLPSSIPDRGIMASK